MEITLKHITVRELTEGYEDNDEQGVVGYGGQLDIRPPYQREFVYKDKQRDAVIDTLTKGFPLNVMYWVVRDDLQDGDTRTFEVMDGQQRTISICQYVKGDFSFQQRYFHNLQEDEKKRILDYELTVYFCTGSPSDKLDWFRTINIVGEPLSNQELRNAVYAGPYITDAKRYFSKRGCPASKVGGDYLMGDYLRQKYLETAIKWISGDQVEAYMAKHQHDPNAVQLWNYFRGVIDWARAIYPTYRREMKGVPWGELYNQFNDKPLDPAKLDAQVAELMEDEEVKKKSGIFSYLLDGQERHLSLRAFDDKQKREAYERQKGICVKCGEHFAIEDMEADHITPWHEGGKTVAENCQMLCLFDNRSKGKR
ncbi:HNH endonuclease family protein [Nocardioides massiliensis]|uniref:C2H2-type domain-containing protein n=1 Tax=Nocardioides massiliensis TaxID=1325935 RepID=A0ABT9NKV1_9ACTN|nr:DUF262 domain-containing protein [Nocardioides massiliensis]MDP9821038.1 hypothetical protein [Nocardioides massiliensis]